MKRLIIWTSCLLFICCIGEDFVDDYVNPNLRITNAIISIREGLSYQFEALFFDESGRKVENPVLEWFAIPPTAIEIQPDGTITALQKGNVMLTVKTIGLQGNTIEANLSFEISPGIILETATSTTETAASTSDTSTTTTETSTSTTETSTTTTDTSTSTSETSTATSETSTATSDTSTATTESSTSTSETSDTTTTTTESSTSTTDNGIVTAVQFFEGQIYSTSGYVLQGNYRYENNGTQIILSLDETYRASSSLPGLYLYLTNNPNSPEDGYEVEKVPVFAGAHSYTLPMSIGLMDYKYLLYWCKPFRVEVGEAQLFDN